MIRRHPHVFGEDTAQTAGKVLRNWEAIKAAELEAKGKRADEGSMLDSVSTKLPAVMEAFQMTTKSLAWIRLARRASVLESSTEEVEELKQRWDEQPTHKEIAGEVGDLLSSR